LTVVDRLTDVTSKMCFNHTTMHYILPTSLQQNRLI